MRMFFFLSHRHSSKNKRKELVLMLRKKQKQQQQQQQQETIQSIYTNKERPQKTARVAYKLGNNHRPAVNKLPNHSPHAYIQGGRIKRGEALLLG